MGVTGAFEIFSLGHSSPCQKCLPTLIVFRVFFMCLYSYLKQKAKLHRFGLFWDGEGMLPMS